jgi:hypothetical protein
MSAETSKTRNPKRPPAPRPGAPAKRAAERPGRQAPEARAGAEDGGFRPTHLFAIVSLVAAGGGVLAVGGASPTNAVFVALAIGSVGFAAFLLYRAVLPLVAPVAATAPDMVGGRTRAALEREKAAVLRAIKELEFDRAMRKVSEADFQDMSGRLRARAVGLIRQLDTGSAGYREIIERELSARVAAIRNEPQAADAAGAAAGDLDAPPLQPEPANQALPACSRCGVLNDSDAQFCKQCGNKLID